MKKILIAALFLFPALNAYCDVIYYPKQKSFLSYSAELVYSFEKVNKPKTTTSLWGGFGCVGSFNNFTEPAAGLELAIERRHYFQENTFKHFFISGYLGAAYMTDFNDISDFGIVPGIKLNYKGQLSPQAVIEPYVSLSVPLTWETEDFDSYTPLPVITLGIRVGLCNLKTK
jgi:hypothetical protein